MTPKKEEYVIAPDSVFHRTKEQIIELWKKHELNTTNSYAVDYIKGLCEEFGIEFLQEWIYTGQRYRELRFSQKPSIDAEDFLISICKAHGIEPDKNTLELSNRMFGEGSRRRLIQEAYLGFD